MTWRRLHVYNMFQGRGQRKLQRSPDDDAGCAPCLRRAGAVLYGGTASVSLVRVAQARRCSNGSSTKLTCSASTKYATPFGPRNGKGAPM